MELGQRLPQFEGCIGYIDGTLVEIRRPWQNENHARWFNGRKKMYSMNNIVVIDHDGLFIHVDTSFPGSYHDVNVLRHSPIYQDWQNRFVHSDDYQQYLLGDPGYIGEEMFIMRRLDDREMTEGADVRVVNDTRWIQSAGRMEHWRFETEVTQTNEAL